MADTKPYDFTHLHVHTEYSLLDGSAKINQLIERTKLLNMDSIAITDHGVMYGVIDFYKAAKAYGIKPIIGCEVYVATASRFNKEISRGDNNYFHLVLLAENNEGYQNLITLVSLGFTEGFYYKPRVDIELLRKYHKNIIALSACLAGPVSYAILNSSYDDAKEVSLLYDDIFGRGNFYLELQDHGIAEQNTVNQSLIRLSKETGIPLVCTNDIHYIYKEDYKAHDILLCIQTAKTVDDDNRMKYEGSEFYLKSAEQMYEVFPYAKEALVNTSIIAQRCNVDFTFHEPKLPKFNLIEGLSAYEYLKSLCYTGLKSRFGELSSELLDRLNYELSVIESMGFVDYFLIVWDFIKFAKDNNIAVGPGRGSAAGSIVAYCLNITDIDPIKHNLLFERFLNPERISMPDIDIDFCYERRQEVIDYCINKYGVNHVAQIITFGTMAARAVIRDVGRALSYSYSDVDKVAKMIPFGIGMTIKKAMEMNPELQGIYNVDASVKYLIDMSIKLEGLPRHASTHAAGVVICERPVMEYVPLNSNDGVITTQFTMNTLEELGLLKMDFLGLRTLTVIQNAIFTIKKNYNIDVNFDSFSEKKVYDLISAGKTDGVFQLESSGMKQFMRELSPSSIEDIIAGVALYRPGPMEFIPKYIYGKNHKADINYTSPKLESILKETYGCIVYQEQVMQIVRDLAGYSLGRSDLVRRAMSKKKNDVMMEERKNFIFGKDDEILGCVRNGVSQSDAEKIFDEMADFAKYAFNKSHAAAYAVIAYQTAWLKVFYPVEFMAALLTSVMDFTSKVSEYIYECRKMSIVLLSPDVNESFGSFTVADNKIRFGLAAIKNVGKNIINSLISERDKNGPFTSFTQFVNRMIGNDLNKRAVESLIKAGAFDSLGGKRSQYLSVYQKIIDNTTQSKKRNLEGQISLFEFSANDEITAYRDILPEMEEYEFKLLLSMEKEMLGIYVSGHPLSEYAEKLNGYSNIRSLDFINTTGEHDFIDDKQVVLEGKEVKIGGLIVYKSIKYTKSNNAMCFIKIEDLFGTVEVIVFPNVYDKCSHLLKQETIVLVKGRISVKEGEDAKIISDEIVAFDEYGKPHKKENETKVLFIKIKSNKKTTLFDGITFILEAFSGNIPVYVVNEITNERFFTARHYWVNPEDTLIADLKNILGDDCVVLKDTVLKK